MANYRQIHTKIWKDGWFLDLPADYKLLFIYLFSNERANLLGLYDLPFKVICFETDLDRATVESGLTVLKAAGKVHYQNGWVWVTNLLRYNAANKDSPKIKAHLTNAIKELPEIPLKSLLIEYYGEWIPYLYDMIPDRKEQEQEQELEQETEQEHELEQQTEHDADTPSAAAAVQALKDFGMSQPEKVMAETELTPLQVIETVQYAIQEGLGCGWVRKQLRENQAHRPRAPDDGSDRRRYIEGPHADIIES